MSKSRYDEAVAVIAEVHATLPPDATEAERRAALFKAYPFGERRFWPYKMWLKAQREYLARWSDKPAGPLVQSALERMYAKAGRP